MVDFIFLMNKECVTCGAGGSATDIIIIFACIGVCLYLIFNFYTIYNVQRLMYRFVLLSYSFPFQFVNACALRIKASPKTKAQLASYLKLVLSITPQRQDLIDLLTLNSSRLSSLPLAPVKETAVNGCSEASDKGADNGQDWDTDALANGLQKDGVDSKDATSSGVSAVNGDAAGVVPEKMDTTESEPPPPLNQSELTKAPDRPDVSGQSSSAVAATGDFSAIYEMLWQMLPRYKRHWFEDSEQGQDATGKEGEAVPGKKGKKRARMEQQKRNVEERLMVCFVLDFFFCVVVFKQNFSFECGPGSSYIIMEEID